MEGIGYEAAPFGKRVMSALLDFIILLFAVLIFQGLLINLFVGDLINGKLENFNVVAINEKYNLVAWQDDEVGTEKKHYIFPTYLLEDIYQAELDIVDPLADEQTISNAQDLINKYRIGDQPYVVLNEENIAAYRDELAELETETGVITLFSIIGNATLVGLVFSFAIPLFLGKDRQTIGRKLFKLGLRTTKGQTAKTYQMGIRLIVGISVEFFISLLFYTPIVLLASVGLSIITKRKQTLRDFFSNTVVVDLTKPLEPVARLDVV